MNATEILFLVFAVLAVGSAVLAMTSGQLVHSALWLAVTLGAVAGCFVLMTAEFVAWVQVLVYVGSIVVLVIFALMMTRQPAAGPSAEVTANRWTAAVLGVVAPSPPAVSYTHLRAHETVLDLVCRLLLEKKKQTHITKPTPPTNLHTILIHYR